MTGHDLPDSWTVGSLSELADVIQGQSPPGHTYNSDGDGVPFFQGKAEFGPIHPIAAKWCTSPTKIAEPGDVLISIRAPVGPTNLADVRCCIGRGLAAIRPLGQLPPRFLLYWLRYTDSLLAQHGTGSTFKAISGTQLRVHPVVIPPFPEQHRIVSALESYFTRLDAVVATLERVQRNLKRYRASVLKAAVEGRLVPTEAELARAEGRSYEPASVLLTRILAERRRRWEEAELAKMTAEGKEPKDDKWKAKYVEPVAPDTNGLPELPEGWCWVMIDLLFDQRLGKMLDHAKNTGDLRPYLRNANVRWFGFELGDLKLMRVEEDELDDVSVKEGDLIVCEGGEPGRAAVWASPNASFVIQKACHRLRPQVGVHPTFYACVFAAEVDSGRLAQALTGSTIKHLTGRKLRQFAVPLPPVAEQPRIVEEARRALSLVEEAEREVQHNGHRLTRLRQSILKWAFEGRLVNQDPTDEPAAVLLERIRAERAATTDTPPRRARRTKARAVKS